MITLLPSLVVMMTSFTRYIISLSFLRSAMGTQNTPPNLVLVGIALFLTLYTMNPVITRIQTEAYEPYVAEEITQEEFFERAVVPLKEFMLRNTETSTMEMYCDLAQIDAPETDEEAMALSLRVIVPAFMTCELKEAFLIGFLLYIPFMLIDIVVSSTLMSMGMIMLPPSMISSPFKLLLFISVNGWQLLFSTLVQSVH
jgi:flagellar biosynthetic protein FliP